MSSRMGPVRLLLLGPLLLIAGTGLARDETAPAVEPEVAAGPLARALTEELRYTLDHYPAEAGLRPYYLAYTVTDQHAVVVQGRLGALYRNDADRSRVLDVDARIGDYGVDSTRQLRGRAGGFGRGMFAGGAMTISLEDRPESIRHTVWRATDLACKAAADRYQRVLTNQKTMVEEEETADDFSREDPSVHVEPRQELSIDRATWAERVRVVSRLALAHPLIYSSGVTLSASVEHRTMVSSEGTRLETSRKLLRVALSAGTKADDGMDLEQGFIFDATDESELPDEARMAAAFQQVIDMTLALREAPLVEPYTGPAILRNRASGVFFHEIFGHRIEGHRQKNVEEGQTFTKMIGHSVLPAFLSVVDDPTRARFGTQALRGFYRFDDEGVAAQRVALVEDGVLQTFLLSRSPVPGFARSNGHGRREPGREVVSRQGNLIVESEHAVPFEQLRTLLVEECRRQHKPFGFLFEDITGGFTTTSRGGPQAFKVLPVVVYRVYADGRPDELVRGVDIVGTPLSCFSKIVATGDDPGVFNGSCGAESGWVPVSAVSPSILVSQIEIEKRQRSQERLPILPAPPVGASGSKEE